MKKLALLLTCSVLAFILEAQTLTDKDVTKFGTFKPKEFQKAHKRVFINNFEVLFEVYEEATATTAGGKSTLGGSTTITAGTRTTMGVMLDGVDNADFKAITNNIYAYFINDLKSNGFEIVSADEAEKIEEFSDWMRKKGGEVNEAQLKGHVKVTPDDFDYFVKRETAKGKEKGTWLSRDHIISKQLDDAIVADVTFVFTYVELDPNSSQMLNRSSVKGIIDFKLAKIAPPSTDYGTKVNFTYGKNLSAAIAAVHNQPKGNVSVQAPVFKDKKFKEVTQASSKTMPGYWTVLSTGKDATSASHYAECNNELYTKESERLMKEFMRISLDRMYTNTK